MIPFAGQMLILHRFRLAEKSPLGHGYMPGFVVAGLFAERFENFPRRPGFVFGVHTKPSQIIAIVR
ncbi:hypothetical protein Pla22_10900 [Rubripirellula amarantea]|uniref:Uncharacterized protein n=1 Tax=Rubripirellula amarantea TaxID=2527999 RepID=A0A5C5WTI4_9BACT|nr:hypothetical protein Pla22_10900 [Rubripirellula amarantea]